MQTTVMPQVNQEVAQVLIDKEIVQPIVSQEVEPSADLDILYLNIYGATIRQAIIEYGVYYRREKLQDKFKDRYRIVISKNLALAAKEYLFDDNFLKKELVRLNLEVSVCFIRRAARVLAEEIEGSWAIKQYLHSMLSPKLRCGLFKNIFKHYKGEKSNETTILPDNYYDESE